MGDNIFRAALSTACLRDCTLSTKAVVLFCAIPCALKFDATLYGTFTCNRCSFISFSISQKYKLSNIHRTDAEATEYIEAECSSCDGCLHFTYQRTCNFHLKHVEMLPFVTLHWTKIHLKISQVLWHHTGLEKHMVSPFQNVPNLSLKTTHSSQFSFRTAGRKRILGLSKISQSF